MPENSPVGDSQSNGLAERSVRRLQEQIRTLLIVLESRIGHRLPMDSNIAAWLIEYASTCLNSRQPNSSTGKTPYEEIHGKKASEPKAEFGEAIMYVPLKGAQNRKLQGEPRSYPGHWLGTNLRTGENIIGTSQGVVKARDVWRRATDEM